MNRSRAEVNQFFHGPVDVGYGNSADYVVAHGERQRQRGKNPSVSYRDIKNPKKAFERALNEINGRGPDDPRKCLGRVVTAHYPPWIDPSVGQIEQQVLCNMVNMLGAVGVIFSFDGLSDDEVSAISICSPNDGTIHIKGQEQIKVPR